MLMMLNEAPFRDQPCKQLQKAVVINSKCFYNQTEDMTQNWPFGACFLTYLATPYMHKMVVPH